MKDPQKKSFKEVFARDKALNRIEFWLVGLTCVLFVSQIILSKLLPNMAQKFSIAIGCVVICSLVITRIIEKFKDKLKRQKMQTTIEDYNKQDDILSIVLNLIVCVYFAVIIYYSIIGKDSDFEKWNLTNTNIGLYSFIFVIFTFILPTYKKEIKNIENRINEELARLTNENETTQSKVAFLMSEIYFFKKEFNLLTQNIVVNGILFVMSILSVFVFEFTFSKILSIASIIFCCLNVISILFELKRLYNYNLSINK